eukprot:7157877-Karenia_brevis.AAC.1
MHQAPNSVSTKDQAHPCTKRAAPFPPSAKLILHQAPSSASIKRQAYVAPSAKQLLHQAPS